MEQITKKRKLYAILAVTTSVHVNAPKINCMSKFTRVSINTNHPTAKRGEAFLNSWEEPFISTGEGKNNFVFRSVTSGTMVKLLFFDSYEEANTYGELHFNPVTATSKWNVNGDMLYAVSGNDSEKVMELASHFAGKE